MSSQGEKLNLRREMPCLPDEVSEEVERIILSLDSFDHRIDDLTFRVEMALREMLANAIEHGCRSGEEKILIEVEAVPGRVKISVSDPGDGFDWRSANLDHMPVLEEKGRGLGMIKQAADELKFNEKGNRITVIFSG